MEEKSSFHKLWNIIIEHLLSALFIVAVIVRVVYLYNTDVYIRQHDTSGAFGHIDYIKYIAEHSSLPTTDQWQFYYARFLFYTSNFRNLFQNAKAILVQ